MGHSHSFYSHITSHGDAKGQKMYDEEKVKVEREKCEEVLAEEREKRNIKKEIKPEKSVGVREGGREGVRVERKRGGRVGWLLIRVNDGENPPIRAFSCVAG